MKKIKVFLFMLVAWVTGIAQCPPADTTITDTSLKVLPGHDGGVNLYCGPYDCTLNALFDYSVDVTVNDSASIIVFGMEATAAHVAIYDSTCTYKLWDTCGTWFYPDNIQLRDTMRLPPRYRLVITPDGTGPIAVSYVQIFPRSSGRIVAPEQCDPTSVQPPIAGDTKPEYTHYFTRASSGDYPTEPGVYIISWPESPYRPREKIVILH